MRTMLKICMDTEAANRMTENGELSPMLRSLIEELRPEASYFFAERGKRGALMVFDMKDTAQIPVIAETLFTKLGADIEFLPVMNAEEVARGIESWNKKHPRQKSAA